MDATEDKEMEDKASEEVAPEAGDGVKLLEEVFGSKASVSSTGPSDDNSSSSSKDTKTEGSEEAKKGEPAKATEIIGPMPPADDDFEESELKKAEEHKTNGNEFFKSKENTFFCGLINIFCEYRL